MAQHALIQPTYLEKFTKVILRIVKRVGEQERITTFINPCSNNLPNSSFSFNETSTGNFTLSVPHAEKIFSITSDNHKSYFGIYPIGKNKDYRFIETEIIPDDNEIKFKSYKAVSSVPSMLELISDIDLTVTLYYKNVVPDSINGYHSNGFLALHIKESKLAPVYETDILQAYSNIPNLKVWVDSKLEDTEDNYENNQTVIEIHPPYFARRGMVVRSSILFPASSNVKLSARYNKISARTSNIFAEKVQLSGGGVGNRYIYSKSYITNGFVFIEFRIRPSRLLPNWRMKRFSAF